MKKTQVEGEIYDLVSVLQRNRASAVPAKAGGIYGCPAPVNVRPYLSCLLCRWGGSHGNNTFHLEIYCLLVGALTPFLSFQYWLFFSADIPTRFRTERDGKGLFCIPLGCQLCNGPCCAVPLPCLAWQGSPCNPTSPPPSRDMLVLPLGSSLISSQPPCLTLLSQAPRQPVSHPTD